MKDLGIFLKIPPHIYCDNINASALASNPIYHTRMKHVEVDYHFIREEFIRGDIQVRFVGTIDQLADIFTKGLGKMRFQPLMTKLHVIARWLSLRGHLRGMIAGLIQSNLMDKIRSVGSAQFQML